MNKLEKRENYIKNKLAKIKISDYSKSAKQLNEWTENKETIPENIWNAVKEAKNEKNLYEIILVIKKELLSFFGETRDTAKSFKDSRFTSLKEMINRHMTTCGSTTKIIGSILRKFGIPTKFIHGILGSQKKSFFRRVLLKNRHAWLSVYDPNTKKWVEFDLTQENLDLYPDAEKIKEYHDWDELKTDYKNGNF